MAKTERFAGQNVDLERLATRIETYLQDGGFEVAYSKDSTEPASWFFIQARKTGALRTMAGARRSTNISIKGEPDNFDVTIGVGEWGTNMISSMPLFIVPAIGITATLIKVYKAKKFESNIWQFIRDQVGFLSNSVVESRAGTRTDTRVYECDYVEGYPGWPAQVEGGSLLLERQGRGENHIVFKAGARQIAIPASQIVEASIIARRKGLQEDDLMIQVTCKDEHGKTIKPIFNINDDIIRGVLAGINELTGEDKVLRSFEQVNVVTDVKFCTNCGIQIPKNARFCSQCGTAQQ